MNERIRGFEKQCWRHQANCLDAEKFAELIVRECAEVADNADATSEKWQSIGKSIREHFGVEQ